MEHKLISGGEVYLPFARSRIKALRAMGMEYASQRFEMPDGTVNVQIVGEHEYIRIEGGGYSYEFVSCGDSYVIGTEDSIPSRLSYAVGVNSERKARGTGANAESPPPGSNWKYSALPSAMNQFLPHKNLWQLQSIVEHAYFASVDGVLKGSPTLVDSWQQTSEITNMRIRSMATHYYTTLSGVFRTMRKYEPFDDTYDVAPSLFTSGEYCEGKVGLAPNSDWYKRAAFKTVVHPTFGSRTFIVMVDITNKVYAYPIVDPVPLPDPTYLYQYDKENVPPAYVQSQQIVFPFWVRVHTTGMQARLWWLINPTATKHEYLEAYPQYRWAFNSKCDRMAAIVYRDLNTVIGQDTVGWTTGGGSGPANIGETISTYINSRAVAIKESLSGLVEYSIALNITGPTLGAFTLSVSLNQEIEPVASNVFLLGCDYSWGAKPGSASYGAALDDLIIMSYDYYPCGTTWPLMDGAPGDYTASDAKDSNSNEQANITIKNHTAGTTLKTFVQYRLLVDQPDAASGSYSLRHSQEYELELVSYDLRVMSLMTEALYTRSKCATGPLEQCKKLEFSIYGAVDQTIRLSSGNTFDALMDAFSANTVMTNFIRLPPNESRNFFPYTGSAPKVYDHVAGTTLGEYMEWRWFGEDSNSHPLQRNNTQNRLSGSPGTTRFWMPRTTYDTGACEYARMVSHVVYGSIFSFIAVHPAGHWSITSPVVHAHTGVVPPTTPSQVQQDFIDTVSFNRKSGDGYVEERTSNLALFNAAYGKSLTKADFLYIPSFDGYYLVLTHPRDPTWQFKIPGDEPNKSDRGLRTEFSNELDLFVRGSSTFINSRF